MQIHPRIHKLTIPFTVPLPTGAVPRSVNLYLIEGRSLTLIDSGVAGAEGAILDCIRSLGRRPEELTTLLLSHSHPDHIGAAAAIRAATGCQVLASAEERGWIEDTGLQKRERPVPGFDALVGGSVPLARTLAEGDLLELGEGLTLEVAATPGHSAGSLSYFLREEGLLFSGDAVPLPGDLPVYDDFRVSLESLAKIEALGARLLLEAWGEPAPPGKSLCEARGWLARIDEAVRCAAADDPSERCRLAVAHLGLPPFAANPLTARAFASHISRSGEGKPPSSPGLFPP